MNNLDEAINTIFYQGLEFIIAPFLLVIFTHFAISKEDKLKGLGGYSIELNFVSLYSNLLFYFSCLAHQHQEHICSGNCPCPQVQLALLIVCVFGLFLIIIHQKVKENTSLPRIFSFVFNWLWLGIMILLICLIFGINMHLNNLSLSWKLTDRINTLQHLWSFICCPNNMVLLLLMIFVISLIISIMISAWRNEFRKSALMHQKGFRPNANLSDAEKEKEIKKQINVARDKNSKPEVRAQIYYHAASYYFEKGDLESAMTYITDSKQIALSVPYPENMLLPIRKLKIKTHLALNERDKALIEIAEVEKKLESATDISKKIISHYISELNLIIQPS